ncbi:unnamed protein product, partial [Mesorhabditis belari]|uniref:RNase H type-1 domain-containing protein n=1 Tax=Mesorhabditis belari TaxID=2138241 RepID=A0AAF3FDL6_9BILA
MGLASEYLFNTIKAIKSSASAAGNAGDGKTFTYQEEIAHLVSLIIKTFYSSKEAFLREFCDDVNKILPGKFAFQKNLLKASQNRLFERLLDEIIFACRIQWLVVSALSGIGCLVFVQLLLDDCPLELMKLRRTSLMKQRNMDSIKHMETMEMTLLSMRRSPKIRLCAIRTEVFKLGFLGKPSTLQLMPGFLGKTTYSTLLIPEDDCATYIEIVAVKTALEKLAALPGSTDMDVIVRTDSMNTIQGLKKRNKLKIEDLRKGIDSIKKVVSNYPRGVRFQHVYSHNGDAGNEMADAMASRARKGCTSEKDYQLEEKLVKREKKYLAHGKEKSQYKKAFDRDGKPTSKRYVFIKQNGEAEKSDE